MYRARPWTVVGLLVVTGVVVGFARLGDLAPSVPPPPQAPVEEHDDAADAERCLAEMLKHLEQVQWAYGTGTPMPPVGELPPLPPELCPPESAATPAPTSKRPF